MLLRWLKNIGGEDDGIIEIPDKEIDQMDGQRKKQILEEQLFLFEAIGEFEDGRFDVAAKKFLTFTNVVPKHPIAHILLARSYMGLGFYEKAVEALFNHLRLVDANSSEANIYLGVVYFELGEPELAKERFEQAMISGRSSLMVRENLALAKYESGQYEEALADLYKLKEESPDDPAIEALLLRTLGKLGRWESAKFHLKGISPENPS